MTREEALKALEHIDNYVGIHYVNGVEDPYINPHLKEAVKVALIALRPVSREQMERVWTGCPHCTQTKARQNLGYQYCEHCGCPLTPAAWEEMRKRMAGEDDKRPPEGKEDT